MVADVIINEGGNKIVRVIITRLQPQKEWNLSICACLFKLVGQQLLMQKFIILPLHKFGSKLEEDKGQTWRLCLPFLVGSNLFYELQMKKDKKNLFTLIFFQDTLQSLFFWNQELHPIIVRNLEFPHM